MAKITKQMGEGHAGGELYALLIGIKADLDNIKAIYDAHTHECPGSGQGACRCSTPDTGAAEGSLAASAASATTVTTTS